MTKYKINKAVDELALECERLMNELTVIKLRLEQKEQIFKEKKEQLMNAVLTYIG